MREKPARGTDAASEAMMGDDLPGDENARPNGGSPLPAQSLIGFLRLTYRQSLKSSRSDEWINTYAIRPVASVLVWVFYRLGLSPVQVVLLSALVGTLSGLVLVLDPGGHGLVLGGLGLMAKNLLDAADGQLARATNRVDRVGRFADSLADFWVNGWVTLGTAWAAAPLLGSGRALVLGAAAFLLVLLQCSLFVFYQVSYLRSTGKSPTNRTDERPQEEELAAPPLEQSLQAAYLLLYGWQDRLMAALDGVLLRRTLVRSADRPRTREAWYADSLGLRLSSFLGLGTSLTVYSVLLVAGSPVGALLWIVVGESMVALAVVLYRLLWRGVGSP
jgi:phosphatidylglycerophosphate synthase